MKRSHPIQILSIVMSFFAVIGILSIRQAPVLADSMDASTGLQYVISNGKASVTGFSDPAGFGGSLSIPETLGGASVTGIDAYAFRGCTGLKSVALPKSITTMGTTPFFECSNLAAITVDSLNTSFKSQDGMLFSKDGTNFIYCPEAKSGSVTVPNGVKSISSKAFMSCSELTQITIPGSVTGIGDEVFEYCTNLTSIMIPAGVTSIGTYSFRYCSKLTSINADSSNAAFKSLNGILFSKSGANLIQCPQGKTGGIQIPEGTTGIGANAFEECANLTSVTIPNSLLSIGYCAFMGCDGLTTVRIPGGVTSIKDGAFCDCGNLTGLTVDDSNTVYKSIDGILFSKDGKTEICCPEGKPGDAVIPDGVTSIADCGFRACEKIQSIAIPSSVTSIGANAFEDCVGVTGITIPNHVTTIGEKAFLGCDKIAGITIPSSVTSIGNYTFVNCSSLKDAYFYGNAPAMGGYVFMNCDPGFTVHYLNTSTGFTNPWNGYAAVPFTAAVGVSYQTHVQDIGWQGYVSDGATSGTSGQSKRLEAIRIKLNGAASGIEYRTHVQDIGWQDWVRDDALSGTSGQSKRLEAIQIRLTGETANLYDVYYRVHAENIGWMGWAKNGESAGTAGFSYRLEAIEIRLVRKGDPAPGSTANRFAEPGVSNPVGATVSYKTQVQDIGWMDYVCNGATSGTIGQSKRMEAIQITLQNLAGGIEYRTHVQDYGWMDWVGNNTLSGTCGQSKRLEAIEIRLAGAAADAYDVYYHVHAQNCGWMGWAKNGESAGTAGYGYRLEAIEIVLVPKGGAAPGSTDGAFKQA